MSNVIDFKARVSTSYKLNPVKDETVLETKETDHLSKVRASLSRINTLMTELKDMTSKSFSEEEKINAERKTRLAKERATANERLKKELKLTKTRG